AAVRDLGRRQPESMPKPSLAAISGLAELLDHPELTYPSIHVTGTNGKTTTARMVASLLCGHKLKTGVFISPHVRRLTERFLACEQEIAEGEFAATYSYLAPYFRSVEASGNAVTSFEALTAVAYVWFSDKPVEVGVFE